MKKLKVSLENRVSVGTKHTWWWRNNKTFPVPPISIRIIGVQLTSVHKWLVACEKAQTIKAALTLAAQLPSVDSTLPPTNSSNIHTFSNHRPAISILPLPISSATFRSSPRWCSPFIINPKQLQQIAVVRWCPWHPAISNEIRYTKVFHVPITLIAWSPSKRLTLHCHWPNAALCEREKGHGGQQEGEGWWQKQSASFHCASSSDQGRSEDRTTGTALTAPKLQRQDGGSDEDEHQEATENPRGAASSEGQAGPVWGSGGGIVWGVLQLHQKEPGNLEKPRKRKEEERKTEELVENIHGQYPDPARNEPLGPGMSHASRTSSTSWPLSSPPNSNRPSSRKRISIRSHVNQENCPDILKPLWTMIRAAGVKQVSPPQWQ